MWSSWTDGARAALERTGDALTKGVTNAAKTAREREHQQLEVESSTTETTSSSLTSDDNPPPAAAAAEGAGGGVSETMTNGIPAEKSTQELLTNIQVGWSSMLESTKASIRKAEEQTKATLKKAEEQTKKTMKTAQEQTKATLRSAQEQMKTAQEAVEEQQNRLLERLQRTTTNRGVYYKRDPSLPLDVQALQDAQVVYITDRIITMSHPAMASTVDGDITGERKFAAVGHLLNRRHAGHFMVWNLSEIEYETNVLDNQVLPFSFPGSPSPPLGLLLKILISIEAWLKADDRNVAVLHCLTGKGRTSTVLAAFLCWMNEAGFGDVYQALDYIAACKQIDSEELTIPSQRRYASYFTNMLDGVRPSQPPLMLKRIIMSTAPRYAMAPPRLPTQDSTADTTTSKEATTDANKNDDNSSSKKGNDGNNNKDEVNGAKGGESKDGQGSDDEDMGCAPYLQLFKAGKLLYTTPASLHFQQGPDELPFCRVSDGSIAFHIDKLVQGDILVRCRHLTAATPSKKQQRVSMFRSAFHTGYVPPKVMRLTKAQLDGARTDPRFPEDFFLDLIFEPVDAEQASKIMQQQEEQQQSSENENREQQKPEHGGDAEKADGTDKTADGGSSDEKKKLDSKEEGNASAAQSPPMTLTASTYDTMLHRDSRFWDVIEARRKEKAAGGSATAAGGSEDDTVEEKSPQTADDEKKVGNDTWGPTVGRRRTLEKMKKDTGGADGNGKESGSSKEGTMASGALETFSIGGGLDFLRGAEQRKAVVTKPVAATGPPKRDSLMEALMGALDDEGDAPGEDEEVVIFGDGDKVAKASGRHRDDGNQQPGSINQSFKSSSASEATKSQAEEKDVESKAVENKEAKGSGETKEEVSGETTKQEIKDLIEQVDDDDDGGLDENVDAILGSAAGMSDKSNNEGSTNDLEDLDAELEDLENFLSPAK